MQIVLIYNWFQWSSLNSTVTSKYIWGIFAPHYNKLTHARLGFLLLIEEYQLWQFIDFDKQKQTSRFLALRCRIFGIIFFAQLSIFGLQPNSTLLGFELNLKWIPNKGWISLFAAILLALVSGTWRSFLNVIPAGKMCSLTSNKVCLIPKLVNPGLFLKKRFRFNMKSWVNSHLRGWGMSSKVRLLFALSTPWKVCAVFTF